jgi:hypothetical protein
VRERVLSAAKRVRATQAAIFSPSIKTTRPLAALALLAPMLLALPLSDCGKKGPPNPPPGVAVTYPRSYPRE